MVRQFPAELSSLYEMLTYVREQAAVAGFEANYLYRIELATEEALVNIISYGYPSGIGHIEIDCCDPNEKGLKITIKDKGIPYNPLTNRQKYDTYPFAYIDQPGGYGIFFILKIMDEVFYEREGEHNVLILIKYVL